MVMMFVSCILCGVKHSKKTYSSNCYYRNLYECHREGVLFVCSGFQARKQGPRIYPALKINCVEVVLEYEDSSVV